GLEISAGEHGKHALERLGAFGRDALDTSVSVTGAENEGPRLARQIDVVAEPAGAHHQARVLLAANGLSNSSLHCCLLSPRPNWFDYLACRFRITTAVAGLWSRQPKHSKSAGTGCLRSPNTGGTPRA